MTREEFRDYVDLLRSQDEISYDVYSGLIDGIDTLEQEPSGDLISREAVLDTISELNAISFYEAQEDSKECYYELRQAIKDLSPVKQEPKTVIYSGDGYADGEMVYDMAECPNCGYEYDYGDKDWGLPFCPSCGQKLNWERSDKE